ncbi:MAG: translation elongation factor Ts [Phycisphaerae bacterium]|nr:translation elongation factor Ts [Phycisphaerae bacterium]
MAEITASMVKALRDETGQGMMDCKKALQESGGDVDAARDLLRKKGLVTAEKKAGRATAEGMIAVATAPDETAAAMVEVQCETDFVVRNEDFRVMVSDLATQALETGTAGAIAATEAMSERLQQALATIGENMGYARGVRIAAPRVGTYVHHNDQVGVIVGIDGDVDDETLTNLCMHIAFADPVGVTPEDVPGELVEKEKKFAEQEAAESGKPPEIIEKIVTGKVRKFLADKALLEQPYVRDDKQKVKDILGGATVTQFARFAVGQE